MTASSLRASLFVGLLAVAFAVVASAGRGGAPAPQIPDEFGYLLNADTYAHGRLTNPTPAMWEHFETFHELILPTRAGKYPPGSSLLMALGQALTGEPIVGVWLSYGLMGAALTWMLLGWVPPRWALWGGLFACLWLIGVQATKAGQAAYWATSYWGGSVPATGGALLFGGIRRIVERTRPLDAMLAAFGFGLLAISRPAEGLMVSLLPGATLAAWLVTSGWSTTRNRLHRVGLPFALVLALFASFSAWLNYRVTGSPWKMPYLAYEQSYGTNKPFIWQHPYPTPAYRVEFMRAIYTLPAPRVQSFDDFVRHLRRKLRLLVPFYLPLQVILLLVMVPLALRGRWPWLALGSVSVVLAGLALETWTEPHYFAPAVAPMLILMTLGARRLQVLRVAGARLGPWLVRAVFLWAGASAVWSVAQSVARYRDSSQTWWERRHAIARELASAGPNDLVIVSYAPGHPGNKPEWVHNEANIDAAPVIWARSLGPARDSLLRVHFHDRTAWSLRVESSRAFALKRVGP